MGLSVLLQGFAGCTSFILSSKIRAPKAPKHQLFKPPKSCVGHLSGYAMLNPEPYSETHEIPSHRAAEVLSEPLFSNEKRQLHGASVL